ncbi:MAG: autotransporter-associated beta strand repeat-containing protein [Luteolibacter sp.]
MKTKPNPFISSPVSCLAFVVLSVAGLLAPDSAKADTYDWVGTTNGNLSGTPANWNPNTSVPGSADVARWNAATYTTAPTTNANMAIGELLFDANNTAGVTFGTGALTLTLNGISNVGIQLNSGSGAVSTGSAKFALGAAQSWTNNSGSLLTVGGTIADGGFDLSLDGSGNATLGGVISGTGGIFKSGAGTLTLNGANTFSGAMTVNAGVVNTTSLAAVNTASGIGKGSAVGSAADLVFGGGTLQHTAANVATTDRLFTIGDAIGLTATLDSSATTSTNTMSFTNTGALALGGSGARTLTLTGSNTGTNTLASILGEGAGGSTALVKSGAGTWVLSGTNTYTGPTTISGGNLSVGTTGNLGAAASNLVFDGGTLRITGTILTSVSGIGHAVVINSGKTVGVDINTAANVFTFDQVLNQGTGSLTKAGAGTLVLNQSNTYSGPTTINAGVLQISASNHLGNGSATNVISMAGGKLQSTGGSYDLGVARQITLGASSSIQIDAGALTVSGDITSTVSSTLTFLTAPTGTSSVLISGTVTDGAGGKVTSLGFGTFSGGYGIGTAEITGTNSYSGQTMVDFLQGGAGTLTTSGTNSSLTGTTFVQGGTLNLNNASNGGIAGGLLTLFVGNLKASAATILSNPVLNSNNFGVTGANSITFNGDFTAGAASGRGITNTITAGVLTFNGSNFNLGTATSTGNTYLHGGTGSTVINSLIQDYSGGVGTVGGNLTINTSGMAFTTLTNNASTYTGATSITGNAAATAAHAFGDTTGISISASGKLSLRGDANTSFTKLTGGALYPVSTSASGATINADQATVAGTGAKTMTIGNVGTASTATGYTLNLTGANNTSLSLGAVAGALSGAAGTVTIANAIAGGGSATLASYTSANTSGGETLTFNGVGNTTVTGAVAPSSTTLSLTKSGAGTLTLSGTNTYTGNTNINVGALVLSGVLGSGTVSVANAATLGGNGNIGGNVSIASGGHHALAVAATPGTQVTRAITGTLTLTSGSILDLTAASTPAGGTYILATASSITGTLGTPTLTGIPVGSTVAIVGGNSLQLTVPGGGGSDYDSWAASIPGTFTPTTSTADADHDGLTNQQEYAFGLVPNSGSSVNPITAQLDKTTGMFTYTRRKPTLTGLVYAYEYSTTLGGWTAFTPTTTSTNSGDPVEAITVTVPAALTTNSKIFVRVTAQ